MPKKKPTFEEQFESLRPSIERLAQAILGDAQHLVGGAVSEAAEKGWTKYSSFDEKKGTFQAWIYRILKNTCISELRKLKNRVEPKEGGDIEGVMDEARKEEWLDDDYTDAVHHLIDDYPEIEPHLIPSIEDYMKWKEELSSTR
jgi:RNA polymerase sigma factor (sigma-70 family)